MAKGKSAAVTTLSSYEMLGLRIQRLIRSQGAQREKSVRLKRQCGEHLSDWIRILEEMDEHSNVIIARHGEDEALVRWIWLNPD